MTTEPKKEWENTAEKLIVQAYSHAIGTGFEDTHELREELLATDKNELVMFIGSLLAKQRDEWYAKLEECQSLLIQQKTQTIKDAESYAFKSGELHGIAVERERIKERVAGMKKSECIELLDKGVCGHAHAFDHDYNQALEDILKELI